MKKNGFVYLLMLSFLFALVLGIAPESSLAQPDSGYSLGWWSVDGGGGVLEGSGYALYSAAGQADAGSSLESSEYLLDGGFWPYGDKLMYLPIVVK